MFSVKAGRCQRRGDSKWIDSQPQRGRIVLTEEDGLMHFTWKNLEAGAVIDDLIMFPGDATFKKVQQTDSRVYVLSFESSSACHFYWFQDTDSTQDDENARRINTIINGDDTSTTDVDMS